MVLDPLQAFGDHKCRPHDLFFSKPNDFIGHTQDRYNKIGNVLGAFWVIHAVSPWLHTFLQHGKGSITILLKQQWKVKLVAQVCAVNLGQSGELNLLSSMLKWRWEVDSTYFRHWEHPRSQSPSITPLSAATGPAVHWVVLQYPRL